MACKVIESLEARRDLWSALEYLELVDEIKKAARNLAADYKSFKQNVERFPEMYPLSSEPRLASLGYRKVQAGKYLALYKYESGTVKVAHLFHRAQDYAKLV
jgi:plasmid stabilization system protein ParE